MSSRTEGTPLRDAPDEGRRHESCSTNQPPTQPAAVSCAKHQPLRRFAARRTKASAATSPGSPTNCPPTPRRG